jgi:hypothetical protein
MDVSMSRFTLDADAAALSAALLVAIASAIKLSAKAWSVKPELWDSHWD